MAPESLAKSTLTRTLADVLGDFSDLVAKQIQLARAEITANISSGILASIWLVLVALLFLFAGVLVIQAAVFGIASTGIALHWACLMVAAVLATIGGGMLLYARSVARDTLTPSRSIRQINKDISAAKEHLA
jgi:ABC-type multidrug transport system permease subunit